jgi:hypothetical protein
MSVNGQTDVANIRSGGFSTRTALSPNQTTIYLLQTRSFVYSKAKNFNSFKWRFGTTSILSGNSATFLFRIRRDNSTTGTILYTSPTYTIQEGLSRTFSYDSELTDEPIGTTNLYLNVELTTTTDPAADIRIAAWLYGTDFTYFITELDDEGRVGAPIQ